MLTWRRRLLRPALAASSGRSAAACFCGIVQRCIRCHHALQRQRALRAAHGHRGAALLRRAVARLRVPVMGGQLRLWLLRLRLLPAVQLLLLLAVLLLGFGLRSDGHAAQLVGQAVGHGCERSPAWLCRLLLTSGSGLAAAGAAAGRCRCSSLQGSAGLLRCARLQRVAGHAGGAVAWRQFTTAGGVLRSATGCGRCLRLLIVLVKVDQVGARWLQGSSRNAVLQPQQAHRGDAPLRRLLQLAAGAAAARARCQHQVRGVALHQVAAVTHARQARQLTHGGALLAVEARACNDGGGGSGGGGAGGRGGAACPQPPHSRTGHHDVRCGR